jgi:hypothetical protein
VLELLSLGRWRDLAIALLLFVEWTHLKHEEHSFFAVQKSRSGKRYGAGPVRGSEVPSEVACTLISSNPVSGPQPTHLTNRLNDRVPIGWVNASAFVGTNPSENL